MPRQHVFARQDSQQERQAAFWSVVENRRVAGGRVVQKHVLHVGETNDSQELAWRRSIEAPDDEADQPETLALFPVDHCEGIGPDASIVRLKLNELRLCRPRQWGACGLALSLGEELRLDRFWLERLPASRKGTRWDQELFALVAYRLLAPGLTPRNALEKFAAVQMIDVHIPTADGRELQLTRYTQPEPELTLLLKRLGLEPPDQPPPKIIAAEAADAYPV